MQSTSIHFNANLYNHSYRYDNVQCKNLSISYKSLSHRVNADCFLNLFIVKFLNAILESSTLLLHWRELKNLWQSACKVIEPNLDKEPTLIILYMWKNKRWNSVPMQEVNPSAKCNAVQCMLDGSTCWKQSVIMRQLRYVYLSVGTKILTITNKKLTLGGNTAWSVQLLRSFQFHGMHNSVMSTCPSWPVMYKPLHMEGVSVEIRASDGNCQIFYCNFSGLSTRIISEFMLFFIHKAPRNLFYIWHCNIIEPSTSWSKYLYRWQNFLFIWEMSERIFDDTYK